MRRSELLWLYLNTNKQELRVTLSYTALKESGASWLLEFKQGRLHIPNTYTGNKIELTLDILIGHREPWNFL